MSIFASPTKAATPRTKNIIPISVLFVALLTFIAVMQLFSFEDFALRLETIGLPQSATPLMATFIVTLEVLTLPFALRFGLSPAFRLVSMASGWLVGALLLFVAIFENIHASIKLDAVLGATLPLPVGTWSICIVLALLVLAGWTSWGLFPRRPKK